MNRDIHASLNTQTNTHMHIYVHKHIHIYICIYTHVHTHMHTYIYTYTTCTVILGNVYFVEGKYEGYLSNALFDDECNFAVEKCTEKSVKFMSLQNYRILFGIHIHIHTYVLTQLNVRTCKLQYNTKCFNRLNYLRTHTADDPGVDPSSMPSTSLYPGQQNT